MPSSRGINNPFAKMYQELELVLPSRADNCRDLGHVSLYMFMHGENSFWITRRQISETSWSRRYEKIYLFHECLLTYFSPQKKSRKKICILVLVLSVIIVVLVLIIWQIYKWSWLPQSRLLPSWFQGHVPHGVLPEQPDHKKRAYTRMSCNNLVRK